MVAVSPSLSDTRDALAAEWTRRKPSTPEEIAAFYRESERLGADLEAWHATPERQEWTDAIVSIAKNNGVKSVLDVGAGAGHDLRSLKAAVPALDDINAVIAVEPNVKLAGDLLDAGVCTFTSLDFVPREYDLVICIDVLEHVPDPQELLVQVMDRVKLGGLLIEATATHDQSTPLHLPEIEGWMPDDTLNANGFRCVDVVNRLAVWQKVQLNVAPASVLVVAHREIAAPTVECLMGMRDMGWPVAITYGDALVDRGRAKAVARWYREDSEDVFLMIDDDIVFLSEDAARVVELAREKRSIACAAYPVGDGGHMASRGWPGQELHFGPGKEPVEIRWPATGFMAVHRDVITALIGTSIECYTGEPDAFWPFFQPFPLGQRPGYEGAADYLSEDYAFGQRAMDLGFNTWLDPQTILVHLKIQALSVWNMRGANR